MSKAKKIYVRQSYETRKAGTNYSEPYVALYASMIGSDAYKDLSDKAKTLYVYMRAQNKSCRELPDGQFYFNRAIYTDLGLYGQNCDKQFYRNRDELVSHGFIDILQSGRFTREKSIYKYSDRWQTWEKTHS